MGKSNNRTTVRRLDATRVHIELTQQIPCTLFAREDVLVETEGIEQLASFASVQDTVDALWDAERSGRIGPFWGDGPGKFRRIVLTPDFHRGAGIPVGTVAETEGFVVRAPSATTSAAACVCS